MTQFAVNGTLDETMADESIVRREKKDALERAGMAPYALATERTNSIGEALDHFDAWSADAKHVTLSGRILTTRLHGGLLFADIMDDSGKIQILLKLDEIDEQVFNLFRDAVDPADVVQATGTLFTTKRGEKTLQVTQWKMLTKALLPLPEKFHGLQDVETRYREREMDLLANPEVMHRFHVRSKLVSALRRFLDEHGFMEVETPILQSIPGGANARPFVTHHNALDIDLYLRIATELHLKRLVVGGIEKVYEIGRLFRNEGIDYAHNPEFTSMEMYWAYVGKEEYISFLEEMTSYAINAAVGELSLPLGEEVIQFASPWPRMTFRESIIQACGIDIDEYLDPKALVAASEKKGLAVDYTGCIGIGEHYDQLFKKTARAALVQPTWIFDYPIELKPLANASPDDPTKSASAQLVIMGAEVINAYYHELTDPTEQRRRFMEQQSLREQGSEDAQRLDESFLTSLEHGMPPTAGMGVGIDRLCAFITGMHTIKETILFPTLRPETNEPQV